MARTMLIIMLAALAGTSASSQWTQTSGPKGATVYTMLVDGSSTIAFTSSGIWAESEGEWTRTGDAVNISEPTITGGYIFGIVQQQLVRTTNSGRSWEKVSPPSDTLPISISAVQSTLYVVAGSTLYASTNAGLNWEVRGNTGFFMTVDAIGDDTLYGLRSMFGFEPKTLTRSVDGGRTWTDLNDRIPNAPFSIESTVRNGDQLYVEVDHSIYVSTDLGENWRHVVDTDSLLETGTLVQIHAPSNNNIWILVKQHVNAGGLQFYHFDGSRWSLSYDLGHDFVHAGLRPDGIVVGSRGEILMLDTEDGSLKPHDTHLKASTNIGFASVGDAVFTTATDGIWRTTDKGGSWTRVYKGTVSAICTYEDVLFSFGGFIERSTDQGETWERIDTLIIDPAIDEPIFYPTSIAAGNGSVWVTDGFASINEHASGGGWLVGGVYRSDDKGLTWRNVSSNLPFNGVTFTPVYQVFVNDEYVTILTASGLFRSSDRGGSWHQLPLEPVTSGSNAYVLFGRGDQIVAAIDYANLYRSFDGGSSWEHLTRLPDSVTVSTGWNVVGGGVSLVDDEMYITAMRTYRPDSVTFRNEPRVYRYLDGTLTEITNDFPTGVTFYSFFKHGDRIYAGTEGRSVWTNVGDVNSVSEQDHSNQIQLTVSPMPVTSSATMSISMPRTEHATIRIVDVQGSEADRIQMGQMDLGSHTISLSTDHLATGLYVIRVETNSQVLTARLIKVD